jgi:hypothetical protein
MCLPYVRGVRMYSTLSFFDCPELRLHLFPGRAPPCAPFSTHFDFDLLSLFTPNDPERTKGHTKLVVAPIFTVLY